MRKKILKWSVMLLLLAYIVAMAAVCPRLELQRQCAGFVVEVAPTEGAPYVTPEGVLLTLGDAGLLAPGQRVGEVDTRAIERVLGARNSFESVQCLRATDGKIHIRVAQMVPELRVFTDAESYYINKDGKKMRALPEFHADVPIATGRFSRTFTPAALLPLCQLIEDDPMLRHLVMMIKVDSPHDILLIPRTRGHLVNLGDTSRLASKLADLKLAYRKVLPARGWEYYDTVSVKFRGLITATRRDKNLADPYLDGMDDEDPEEATLDGLHVPADENSENRTHIP